MKANELRIGNWVIVNEECQIEAIIHDVVDVSTRFETYVLDAVKPIPLTEEWLERFGFNDDGFKQYEFTNWGIKVKKDPHAISETNWIVFHGFMNQFSELVSLKHVHQLQNLFYCLSGEELTIKK